MSIFIRTRSVGGKREGRGDRGTEEEEEEEEEDKQGRPFAQL